MKIEMALALALAMQSAEDASVESVIPGVDPLAIYATEDRASAKPEIDWKLVAGRGRAQREWQECLDEAIYRYMLLTEEKLETLVDTAFTVCSAKEAAWEKAAKLSIPDPSTRDGWMAHIRSQFRKIARAALIEYRASAKSEGL